MPADFVRRDNWDNPGTPRLFTCPRACRQNPQHGNYRTASQWDMADQDPQKRLPASFDTKAEAQRWASEIEGDMSRKRFVDTREAEATTVAKAFERYAREVSA